MMLENFSTNLRELDPIRQHCPARAKDIADSVFEDQELENMMMDHDPFLWSPTPDQNQEHDRRDEVEETVDAFFNAECFDEDNRNLMQLLHQQEHSSDQNMQSIRKVDHDQGLQIVHLLLGCAEAVGCRDARVADSILTQISPLVSPCGDSLQRVSYYFAMGLKSRLAHIQNQFIHGNGTFIPQSNRNHAIEAFQLLNQTTPYLSFGFMAANEAICEAVAGKYFLHILNLGSGNHHLQWPSLIRNLASRAEGPPKLLRITSIIEDQEAAFGNEFHHNIMQCILDEASSLGVAVQFRCVTMTPSQLTKDNLNLKEGEELNVNCIIHHYAEEIQNIVASEGSDRVERHLRMDQWRRQLGRAGFQVQGFKSTSQASMMLSVYGCDGFTLSIEKGCLLLGWKGRPIMLASAWKVA